MTTKPLVKHHAIHTAWEAGAPFRVLVTYEGWTANGNRSQKWWSLEYDGKRGNLDCNHGKLGSKGRSVPFRYDVWEARDKLIEKLGKGYDYASGSIEGIPMEAPTAAPKLPAPFDTVTSVRRIFDMGRFVWQAEDAEGVLVATLSDSGGEKLKAMLDSAA